MLGGYKGNKIYNHKYCFFKYFKNKKHQGIGHFSSRRLCSFLWK